jgi:hypothetical protein
MNSGARRVQRVYTGNAVLFVDLRAALMTSRSPAIIRVIIERQNEQSSRQRSKDLGKRKEALLDGEPSAMSFSESFSSARSTFMIPDEVGTYFIPRPVRACALARMHSDVHPSFHRVAGSRANFPVNVADRKAHVSKVTLHLAGGMRLAVCAGISFRCSAEPAQSELYDLFRRRGA